MIKAENDDFECRIGVNQRIVMVCSVIHEGPQIALANKRKNIYFIETKYNNNKLIDGIVNIFHRDRYIYI